MTEERQERQITDKSDEINATAQMTNMRQGRDTEVKEDVIKVDHRQETRQRMAIKQINKIQGR